MKAIQDIYQLWFEDEGNNFGDSRSELEEMEEQDKRFAFLSNVVLGLTTDDLDLDVKFGKDIFEVLQIIKYRKSSEYIKDENNYKKFIIVCNWLLKNNWINYGISIRSCNFNYEEYIFYHDYEFDPFKLTKYFIESLLLFLECK